MEYQDIIEQRYSVRDFSDKAPSPDLITQVLEAGRIAPTARNAQPQRLYVVTQTEHLAAIDEFSPSRYNAPVVLIVGYSKSAAAAHKDDGRGDWTYGEVDMSCAFTHMMLKITDLGMGSCWVGLFNETSIREYFNLPEDFVVVSLLPFGFPSDKAHPSPRHTDRLPLSDTATWL